MKCGFEYCIYNRDFACMTDEPEINSLGMCDACVVLSLDRKFLEEEKKRQLAELERRWVDSTDDNKN